MLRKDVALVVVSLGAMIGLMPFLLKWSLGGLKKYWSLTAIVICAIVSGALTHWLAGRKHRRTLGARAPLSPEAIFANNYADSGIDRDRFVRNWIECARHLEIPAELLRPTDRFTGELAPVDSFDGIGHPLDALFDFAERASAHDPHAVRTLKRMETLGELVCYLSRVAS